MSFSEGDRLGPYEILSPIGAGGMGEVYRAHDNKLNRDVAMKVLSTALAADTQYMARFEREARTLAALNHPNIATVYGIEQGALVMELVEGADLKGPVPLEEAMPIVRQIAAGLEAAHERGIVHRDLKPANIKLTSAGVVKILDFGLAKSMGESSTPSASSPTMSPTLSLEMTRVGMILGTAAYMAPEQARGKHVDHRADIWAFGVVIYEMLTGERLFHGDDITDILASVVKDRPDLTRVPSRVRPLLESCLQKDPKQRLQAIGDYRLLLPDGPAAQARKSPAKWIWPTAAALLLAALGDVSAVHVGEKPTAAPQPVRFESAAPDQQGFLESMALSPDGRQLAFLVGAPGGRSDVWVRDLGALEARKLPGTEDGTGVFWSPDGRFLAFTQGSKLKKIDVTGGPPVTLCEIPAAVGSGTWVGSVIVFGSRGAGPLWRVSASGGQPTQLTRLDAAPHEGFHALPSSLPDGRHFIYMRRADAVENSGVYLGSLDSKPEEQSSKPILLTQFGAVYAGSGDPRTGRLLFLRESTLFAQTFDANRMELTGEPVPVAEQVGSINGTAGFFTASANGILAFRRTSSGGLSQLTWFGRQGNRLGTVGDASVLTGFPEISPDGASVTVARKNPQTGFYDIWVSDFARGTSVRLTSSGNHVSPMWSPDGNHIAYSSGFAPRFEVYQEAASGVGEEEALDKTSGGLATSWSRDGRYLIENVGGGRTNRAIWVLPLAGDRRPYPYVHLESDQRGGRLSPNGQWLAYTSDETKRDEIYAQTFPNPGGKWPVSAVGGVAPVWSRDGKELYYIAADGQMMAVEIKDGAKFQAGVPKALFDTARQSQARAAGFDVSKDGRFLISVPVMQSESDPVVVVLNWTTPLKK